AGPNHEPAALTVQDARAIRRRNGALRQRCRRDAEIHRGRRLAASRCRPPAGCEGLGRHAAGRRSAVAGTAQAALGGNWIKGKETTAFRSQSLMLNSAVGRKAMKRRALRIRPFKWTAA